MKIRTIGQYLIDRLYAYGVRHVFGIPGDYVLGFYEQLAHSKLRLINTCDEQGAGFAADAYARVRGLGAVCVTYCVGGLKVANTTAEAFAEKSPVVVISGAPGIKEREKNPLLHHKVREFDTQKKVFDQLTVAAAVLSDPHRKMRSMLDEIRAQERLIMDLCVHKGKLPRKAFITSFIHNETNLEWINELHTPKAYFADLKNIFPIFNAHKRN